MESSTTSTLILPPLNSDALNLVFDHNHHNFPPEFLWPHEELPSAATGDLPDPAVDLSGFFRGDGRETESAAAQIRTACLRHGFFHVVNHGVDERLIRAAHRHMEAFFNLPLASKLSVSRKPGALFGYSGAHADRFASKLPWKETFSFAYNHATSAGVEVVDDIKSLLGNDFEDAGRVYQEYCEAMEKLAMAIFELLGMSLGVDRKHYREFFGDGYSMMRGNNYPPCKEAGLTFGTGPHADPNSLTILHQDDVGGLEIFSDNKWQAIRPRLDAFVVNIGDTFVALSNGRYKSCLHRAVVNKDRARRSLVFFVNPRDDRVLRPPEYSVASTPQSRQYPDFTWSDLREFTQNHYRADDATLQHFVRWLSDRRPSVSLN